MITMGLPHAVGRYNPFLLRCHCYNWYTLRMGHVILSQLYAMAIYFWVIVKKQDPKKLMANASNLCFSHPIWADLYLSETWGGVARIQGQPWESLSFPSYSLYCFTSSSGAKCWCPGDWKLCQILFWQNSQDTFALMYLFGWHEFSGCPSLPPS